MIKRVSLVWKRPELSVAAFKELWLGEHATLAKTLVGLRGYTIDFALEDAPARPAGIATLYFDDAAALESAFSDPVLRVQLLSTRDTFATQVEIFFVDETVVVPLQKELRS